VGDERAALGHEAHAATAPDGYGVAGVDVAEVGAHVAGRDGVGEKQRLLVGDAVGDGEAVDVGVRDADVLGV
jgi:hypothetical protein